MVLGHRLARLRHQLWHPGFGASALSSGFAGQIWHRASVRRSWPSACAMRPWLQASVHQLWHSAPSFFVIIGAWLQLLAIGFDSRSASDFGSSVWHQTSEHRLVFGALAGQIWASGLRFVVLASGWGHRLASGFGSSALASGSVHRPWTSGFRLGFWPSGFGPAARIENLV